MKKIADGAEYSIPATIDDPAMLTEIQSELHKRGFPMESLWKEIRGSHTRCWYQNAVFWYAYPWLSSDFSETEWHLPCMVTFIATTLCNHASAICCDQVIKFCVFWVAFRTDYVTHGSDTPSPVMKSNYVCDLLVLYSSTHRNLSMHLIIFLRTKREFWTVIASFMMVFSIHVYTFFKIPRVFWEIDFLSGFFIKRNKTPDLWINETAMWHYYYNG